MTAVFTRMYQMSPVRFYQQKNFQLVLVVSPTEMDSDEETALLIILLRRRRRRRRKPRRYWVHPMNATRLDLGQYHTSIDELRDEQGINDIQAYTNLIEYIYLWLYCPGRGDFLQCCGC